MEEEKRAILSEDLRYRYSLSRTWKPGFRALWIGVNPSIADESVDDATVRKIRGFTQSLAGYGGFDIGNLFALRATDVKLLGKAADPIGPCNNDHLVRLMDAAHIIIGAWGPVAKQPPRYRGRFNTVVNFARALGKPIYAFGTTKEDQPRHPLMTPYATPLTVWRKP